MIESKRLVSEPGVLVVDATGIILTVNGQCVEITGLRADSQLPEQWKLAITQALEAHRPVVAVLSLDDALYHLRLKVDGGGSGAVIEVSCLDPALEGLIERLGEIFKESFGKIGSVPMPPDLKIPSLTRKLEPDLQIQPFQPPSPSHVPRILVVDDDTLVWTSVTRYLTSLYVVGSAESISVAQDSIWRAHSEGRPFDLVILDYYLPGADVLGRAAREMLPDLKIIYSVHPGHRQSVSLDPLGTVLKPIQKDQLLTAVQAALAS